MNLNSLKPNFFEELWISLACFRSLVSADELFWSLISKHLIRSSFWRKTEKGKQNFCWQEINDNVYMFTKNLGTKFDFNLHKTKETWKFLRFFLKHVSTICYFSPQRLSRYFIQMHRMNTNVTWSEILWKWKSTWFQKRR